MRAVLAVLRPAAAIFPPPTTLSGSQGSQGSARLSLIRGLVPVQSQASAAVCGLCACQASPSSCRCHLRDGCSAWGVLMPWGVGGCVESIGSCLRSTLGCGAALPCTVLPLSLWDECSSQCCPCSGRCVVAAGLHTPPTTPITTSPQRCNKKVEVCVELSQTSHCKLRILPTIPTPSSLCGLWYFPSPALC